MYADCMFCSRSLGTNEVLETFPIGRRIAFDAERGRLWVVCGKCERWNLAPIEERWEPVEACERMFEETRLKVSTQNIGLGRHLEGLELVRIGRPLRPEFAAWRYGDQFGKRRKRAIAYGLAGAGVVGVVAIGGSMAGITMGPFMGGMSNLIRVFQYGGRSLTLHAPDGRLIKVHPSHLQSAKMRREGETWHLELKTARKWGEKREESGSRGIQTFRGEDAERAAGLLLTRINYSGGKKDTVQQAVRAIESDGHPRAFLENSVKRLGGGYLGSKDGTLAKMPVAQRLAMEMALHEERERQALEGELRGLEAIWRTEEEIAAISDDLLVTDSARGRLSKLAGR